MMNWSNRKTCVQAWRINMWLNFNVAWVLYGILSGAILLQQFPQTEPLVLGFFWLNLIAFFFGAAVSQAYGVSSMRGVVVMIAITILGVLVQAYLAVCHWETLVLIDNVTRMFRATMAAKVLHFGDHLIFGRVIWILLTINIVFRILKTGVIVHRIPRDRPW